MKSFIFKAAHQQTKQVIQAGDNYAVTFGAVLKSIYKKVKGITQRVAPLIAKGFLGFTVEHRMTDNKGGYCMMLSQGNQGYNVTQILNKATRSTAYYLTHDGQAKSFGGRLAVFIIHSLIKKGA